MAPQDSAPVTARDRLNDELERAVEARDWGRAADLVAQGADPDSMRPAGECGRTLLQRMSMARDIEAVEQLIELGADVNRPYFTGASLLSVALDHGEEIIWALIRAGAVVESSMLNAALRTNSVPLQELLLAHGASLTARDPNTGHTPLEFAARSDNLDAARWLLDHGVSPAPSPEGHMSPLAIAEYYGREYVAALLRNHGATAIHPGCPPVCPDAPDDWSDAAGWDGHFRFGILRAVAREGRELLGMPTGDQMLSRRLRELAPGERIVIMGNGLSALPHALCAAGHHAVAVDLSSVATEFLRRGEFPPPQEGVREGGSVELICGDIRDAAVAPGPFSIGVSHRSLQGLAPDVLEEAIVAIDRRIDANGTVHFATQNAPERFDHVTRRFKDLGYVVNPKEKPAHGKTLRANFFSG